MGGKVDITTALFSWAPKSLRTLTAATKLKDACFLGRKDMTKLDKILKKERHHFADKGPYSCGFSISHICIWELDHKESWALKSWCFWTVVLEKTFESPLDCKEIQPVHPKGDQSWIFIGRTDWNWSSNSVATWYEVRTHWKRPWFWERLRARGEEYSRGWDS